MTDQPTYDAILLVSFGGPEGPEEVMPFLERVTQGRGVPRERLLEVAEHYDHFGGKSPLPGQVRELRKAIVQELREYDVEVPVYIGFRNSAPFLADTLRVMKAAKVKRAIAFVTSAFSSYSGCRQYLENIEQARREVGEGAPEIDKLRVFYDHPLYVLAMTDRVHHALASLTPEGRKDPRLVFTAHSIPTAMARGCQYEAQLKEASRLVAERCGIDKWSVAYQSRSGSKEIPWLEPDICEVIAELPKQEQSSVVVVPIGFVSDHVEVLFDLDVEARDAAASAKIEMVRAGTAGVHPAYVKMIRELIEERTEGLQKRALGTLPICPDVCAPDCCPSGRPAGARPINGRPASS